MVLTKSQKEFIGKKFSTPKGGVLTVVGVVGKSGSGTAVFSLECSVCSKDEKLWSKYSIKSVKHNLVNGYIPCGCAFNPRWTEYQNKVRVEEECKERGYVFNGWSGKFKGVYTKLDLHNPKTGNCWESTSVSMLLNGYGDPVEGREKTRQGKLVPDEQHVQEFMKTGKFQEGVEFWRREVVDTEGKKIYWNYFCTVCSKDEYVKNGLCSGVFESLCDNLKKGQLSCRCSKNYRWSQEQREYQIRKICREEGYTFKGWGIKMGYKNKKSKFKWECAQVHDCITSVDNFLNKGNRCMECSRQVQKESGAFYGYYPLRTEEQDNLYLIHFKTQNCIKVGRTFDVRVRLKGNRGLLKSSGCTKDEIEILKVLTGTHQEVYDTEQWIHGELTEQGFYHEESEWTVETFKESCLQTLYKLVDESGLEESVLNYRRK